jgi:hypothetical protein
MRAKMSRPFPGSTPNQCSAEIPPRLPIGTPPRSESTADLSKVYGPQPLIAVISGARIASSTTSTMNATLSSTGGLERRVAITRRAGVGAPTGAPTSSATVVSSLGTDDDICGYRLSDYLPAEDRPTDT